jgi:SecD/SecF fusion protein
MLETTLCLAPYSLAASPQQETRLHAREVGAMRSCVLVVSALLVLSPAFGQANSPSSPTHPAAKTIVLRPAAASAVSAKGQPRVLHAAAQVVASRLRETGVASPAVVVNEARGTLAVTIPANRSDEALRDLLTRPARLEFRYLPQLDKVWRTVPEVVKGRETGFERILGPDGRPVRESELAAALSAKAPFTGADLKPTCRAESIAASPQSPTRPNVGVHFEFKPEPKARFKTSTGQHIGQSLAIFIDGRLLSSPRIQQPIPGVGIIIARWNLRQASGLAAQLNSGPLPVPLEVVRQ